MGYKIWLALGAGSLIAGLSLGQGDAEAKASRQYQAQVELGRRLFFDPVVSGGGKFSCADCHDPEHGFSDKRDLSFDVTGPTARHSQPLTDLGGEGFHWDGEFDTLRQLLVARLALPRESMIQARALHESHFAEAETAGKRPDKSEFDRRIQSLTPPYYGPVTPGGPAITPTAITQRLTMDNRYQQGFTIAFGSTEISADRMIEAMEKYLLTLKSTESPYDRFKGGDKTAINEQAQRGASLFRGKAGCAQCHVEGGVAERGISDGKFHNTGVAMPFSVLPDDMKELAFDLDKPTDQGRARMSFAKGDTGQFKTPSLRDVAIRPPYMHDASLGTLKGVVEYYNGGGTPNSHIDARIRKLGLTAGEVDDVVAFLQTLTGDTRAGLGPVPRYREKIDAKRSIRIEDLKGAPLRETDIRIVPIGDRLQGTASMPRPFTVKTDKSGNLAFKFPLSTHVTLEADGYEIGESRLVPDTMKKATFIATPIGVVSVRVRLPANSGKLPDVIELTPFSAGRKGSTTANRYFMKQVRKLGTKEALYSMPVSTQSAQRGEQIMHVFINSDSKQRRPAGTFELDLDGGASDPIDLRPILTSTVDLRDLRRTRRRRNGATPGQPRKPGVKPPSRTPGGVVAPTPKAPVPKVPTPRKPTVPAPSRSGNGGLDR